MSGTPCIVTVDALSFRYPDGTPALDHVSLCVAESEKVALVGPNGSGKSTLLLHLNGLLHASSGSITVTGLSVSAAHLAQIRAAVGFVFQNPDDQLFSPLVYGDVAFGPLNLGLPESEVRARVESALAAVGMAGFAQRVSHHLSVGEKKRIALATVLSMEPKILVLDEPSAGLDPRGRRSLIDLLQSLRQQTMLISTHDMRLAYELCSRTLILDQGRLVAQGATHDILNDAALMEQHGLERPYSA